MEAERGRGGGGLCVARRRLALLDVVAVGRVDEDEEGEGARGSARLWVRVCRLSASAVWGGRGGGGRGRARVDVGQDEPQPLVCSGGEGRGREGSLGRSPGSRPLCR